jgi:catechol 2,3-dioxygenase
MKRFYEEVLGLEILGEFPHAVFFKIAEGVGGHTQILALFDRSTPVGAERTTIDHFAFTIEKEDYDTELERLEGLGLDVTVSEHAWVHWRSLYFHDPEGNRVELVCYDSSVE